MDSLISRVWYDCLLGDLSFSYQNPGESQFCKEDSYSEHSQNPWMMPAYYITIKCKTKLIIIDRSPRSILASSKSSPLFPVTFMTNEQQKGSTKITLLPKCPHFSLCPVCACVSAWIGLQKRSSQPLRRFICYDKGGLYVCMCLIVFYAVFGGLKVTPRQLTTS